MGVRIPEAMAMDKLQCGAALILCSIIEMWVASVYCDGHTYYNPGTSVIITSKTTNDCDGMWAWAVAVGVISLVFSSVYTFLAKMKPELAEGIPGYALATFLFLLWICGAAVGTYWKPFAPGPGGGDRYGIAGNGFFATWGGVVFSGMLVIQIPPVADLLSKFFGAIDETKKIMMALFGSSMVEMWHAAEVCDDDAHCEGMLGWGVAVGVVGVIVTLVWGLVSHFVPNLAAYTKFVPLFLVAWWLSAVLSLTMPNNATDCGNDTYCQGLFLDVSNGFIGTWGSLGLSVWLAIEAWSFALAEKEGETDGKPTGEAGETPAYVDAVKPPEAGEAEKPAPVAAPAAVTAPTDVVPQLDAPAPVTTPDAPANDAPPPPPAPSPPAPSPKVPDTKY